MRERGTAAYALISFMVVTFVVILIYVMLSSPIEEILGTTENAATESAPEATWDLLDVAWSIWPLVIIILSGVWVIVHVYRREYEHGYAR